MAICASKFAIVGGGGLFASATAGFLDSVYPLGVAFACSSGHYYLRCVVALSCVAIKISDSNPFYKYN